MSNAVTPSLVRELKPVPEPHEALRRFARLPHCLLMESVLRHERLGRYSFLMAEPFDVLEATIDSTCHPLKELQCRLNEFDERPISGLPPFQGGAAGLVSYDLNRTLEQIPEHAVRDFDLPTLSLGFYDALIAWDHEQSRAWAISTGLPETNSRDREQRATQRMEQLLTRLHGDPSVLVDPLRSTTQRASFDESAAFVETALAERFPCDGLPGLYSNLHRDEYLQMIRRGIEYIHAGDVFQVNLAQRLLCRATDSSVDLFCRLRERNPATFATFYDVGPYQIISASPERLIKLIDRQVETRPIKGTSPITRMPEADLYNAQQLLQSEKDLAENIMIVDLLRNDLSKVCEPDSVHVNQLCELERYEYVNHLVSSVLGSLRDDVDPIDLLEAVFPGGSITGAPKVRAMEIIAELEPTARGAYCGSIGYVGFNGNVDFNILIRTITAGNDWWQLPVGGGIVADSLAEREFEETWTKARGMIRALAT